MKGKKAETILQRIKEYIEVSKDTMPDPFFMTQYHKGRESAFNAISCIIQEGENE